MIYYRYYGSDVDDEWDVCELWLPLWAEEDSLCDHRLVEITQISCDLWVSPKIQCKTGCGWFHSTTGIRGFSLCGKGGKPITICIRWFSLRFANCQQRSCWLLVIWGKASSARKVQWWYWKRCNNLRESNYKYPGLYTTKAWVKVSHMGVCTPWVTNGHYGPNSRLLSPSSQMIYDFHPKISAKQVMGDFWSPLKSRDIH